MAAMMGMVEKEEPMPMVMIRPTTSINKAASPRLSPMAPSMALTKVSTLPVALMTAAKPEAVIMMKPIMAIMWTPRVKTSCVSRQWITPPRIKTTKPIKAPSTMEFVANCTLSAAMIANTATQTERRLMRLCSGSADKIRPSL